MTYLTADQVGLLLKPIHPKRVLVRDGMSYVEGYDIKAELNRVLGFGRWSTEILEQTLICETAKKMGNGRDGWYVAYRTSLRLTVKAPDGTALAVYEESHVGDSTHPVQGEAHGNALTNSHTYALKRCATNLGDQFGLSLYGKGSMDALVRWTLVRPEAGESTPVNDDDVPQVAAETPESAGAQQDAAPAPQDRPRPANGRTVRPESNGKPAPAKDAEPDPDAQVFADEAHQARTVAALRDVNTRAREAHKLASIVRSPGGEGTGGLGQYIALRKKQLEDDAAALAELQKAAEDTRTSMEALEIHVQKVTGTGIEGATPAQLREAAEALKEGVPA